MTRLAELVSLRWINQKTADRARWILTALGDGGYPVDQLGIFVGEEDTARSVSLQCQNDTWIYHITIPESGDCTSHGVEIDGRSNWHYTSHTDAALVGLIWHNVKPPGWEPPANHTTSTDQGDPS